MFRTVPDLMTAATNTSIELDFIFGSVRILQLSNYFCSNSPSGSTSHGIIIRTTPVSTAQQQQPTRGPSFTPGFTAIFTSRTPPKFLLLLGGTKITQKLQLPSSRCRGNEGNVDVCSSCSAGMSGRVLGHKVSQVASLPRQYQR